jgi:broad specificity phosphatase PhoE
VVNLILIRHGEAQHLVTDLTGGWTDTALTPLGLRQAKHTADRLVKLVDTKPLLFTSSLQRCMQTAQVIATRFGVSAQTNEGLRDINNGTAANLTRRQARKLSLPVSRPVIDWVPYPGAESWRMLQQRIIPFLQTLPVKETPIVLVTHATVIAVAVQWWLGMGDDLVCKTDFVSDPCSITRMTINSWGDHTLVKLNDTAHLESLQERTETS